MASVVPAKESARPIENGFGHMQSEDVVRERRPVVYRDPKTKLILKTVFSRLCPACEKYLKQVEREVTRLKERDPPGAGTVNKVSQQIIKFIQDTEQVSANLDSFRAWNLHGGNVHSEFCKVAQETFKGGNNWGRVLMFFSFALSFSVYLEAGLVVGASDSVLEWTCQIVEEELGGFFTAHQGWEGLADYLETALRATHRSQLKKRQLMNGETSAESERGTSLWQGAFAAGAVAVGAMAALTLRQAFS